MRKLYLVLIIAFVNSANNGYDGSMIGTISNFAEYSDYFNLGDKGVGQLAGVINGVLSLGGMLGGLFAGPLTDLWGRRVGMTIGSIIVIVGAVIQASTTSYAQLVVGRFIVGFGIPVTVTAAPVWVAELSPPSLRGTIGGFYNTFWFVGSSFATITGLGVVGYPVGSNLKWRIPLALQAAPSVFVLLTIWFLPESPRWLIAHGREAEGVAILARYHADGDESAPIVQEQKEEILARIEDEKAQKNSGSFIKLISSRPALHRLAICFIIAMYPGNSVISYYLPAILATANITNPTTSLVINTLLNVFSWVAAVSGALSLVDRWGRRKMALLATINVVVGYVLITALTSVAYNAPDGNFGATVGVVVFIYVTNIVYGIGWTPLQAIYPTEIQEYVTRGKAIGVTQFFFQLQGLIFNYANAVGIQNLAWEYYIVIAALNLLWVIAVYFLFVETKGRTMEELAVVFESSNPVKASLIPLDKSEGAETKEVIPSPEEGKSEV